MKATESSAKNQCNDGIDEFAKDAIENEYEFIEAMNIEARHAVKYIEYCAKHMKHIVD